MFCPKVVVFHLLKEFGSCDITQTPSRKEQKVIESFSSILRDAMYDNLVIDCEEDEAVEEDHNDPLWSPDESDDDDGPSTSREGTFYLFGDVEVSKEKVDEAIAFYRSSTKKSRTLSCMKSKFRFITTEYHLRKLREIERDRAKRADRIVGLRRLADLLKEEVIAKMNMGISLHDSDIHRMALKINKEGSIVKNFKASHGWIQGFKSNCGIVSRRITTFTSRKGFLDKDRISREAQAFVLEVKKGKFSHDIHNVCVQSLTA
uniref:HTH CENPB-type domain-containing protein n=1 Tax=Haemonchus contortus TaxID=6289 RepID=A0A7I4Z2I7_HAECO